MEVLKRILLVEDDPKDVELILAALAEHKLAKRSCRRSRWCGSAGLSVPARSVRKATGRQPGSDPAGPEDAPHGRGGCLAADQGGRAIESDSDCRVYFVT